MRSGTGGHGMAFSPWLTHSKPSEMFRAHPIRDPRQPALGQREQAYPRLEKESPCQEKSQVPQP